MSHLPRTYIGGRAGTMLLCALWLAGCGARPETRAPAVPPPPEGATLESCEALHGPRSPDSVLPVCVLTDRGALAVEAEYLPGVVDCEIGGVAAQATAALEAQAVAARTYLLAHLQRNGETAHVRLGPRFQCWRAPRRIEPVEAVSRTRGVVMHVHGDVLDANYVSGAPARGPECAPDPPDRHGYPYASWEEMAEAYRAARKQGVRRPFPGTAWTEVLVTRNGGRRGDEVLPTPIAPRRPTNRGGLGQYAAACLAGAAGYDLGAVLRYFYGEDVQLSAAQPTADSPPQLLIAR